MGTPFFGNVVIGYLCISRNLSAPTGFDSVGYCVKNAFHELFLNFSTLTETRKCTDNAVRSNPSHEPLPITNQPIYK
jgi:hypothetical protein